MVQVGAVACGASLSHPHSLAGRDRPLADGMNGRLHVRIGGSMASCSVATRIRVDLRWERPSSFVAFGL
jgi:hypothetical protein